MNVDNYSFVCVWLDSIYILHCCRRHDGTVLWNQPPCVNHKRPFATETVFSAITQWVIVYFPLLLHNDGILSIKSARNTYIHLYTHVPTNIHTFICFVICSFIFSYAWTQIYVTCTFDLVGNEACKCIDDSMPQTDQPTHLPPPSPPPPPVFCRAVTISMLLTKVTHRSYKENKCSFRDSWFSVVSDTLFVLLNSNNPLSSLTPAQNTIR